MNLIEKAKRCKDCSAALRLKIAIIKQMDKGALIENTAGGKPSFRLQAMAALSHLDDIIANSKS